MQECDLFAREVGGMQNLIFGTRNHALYRGHLGTEIDRK